MTGQKKFFGREDDIRSWIKRIYSEVESMKDILDNEDYSIMKSEIDLSLRAEAGVFPEKEYINLVLKPLKSSTGKIDDFDISGNSQELLKLGFSIKRNKRISAGILAGGAKQGFLTFLIETSKSKKTRITEFYNNITDHYFQAVVNPQKDGTLEVLLQDLTSFQKNKLQVKHYADLYCKAEESSSTGFFQYTTSNQRILVSEGVLTIFECPPQAVPTEYVTLEQYLSYVHEDDKEFVLSMISEDTLSSSMDFVHRVRIRNLVKYINVRGGIFYDSLDDSISMIGTVQDVTEHMLLKEKLHLMQKNIDEIEKITMTASWNYSFLTDEFSGSWGVSNILGISPEDFPISLNGLINMLQEEEREEVYSKFQHAVTTHQDMITDFELIDKVGNKHQIHMICWTCYTDEGKPDFSRGYFVDQTELKDLLNRMSAQKEELAVITEELNMLRSNYAAKLQKEIKNLRKQDKYRIQEYKWSSISNLLRDVAVHWQEPLQLLSTNLQNVFEEYQYGEITSEEMQIKQEELKKIIGKMSRNLSAFQEHFCNNSLREKFSVRKMLEEIISITGKSLEQSGIELILNAKSDIELQGEKADLSEPVINVISNASRIIRKRKISNPKIEIVLHQNTDHAVMDIYDNGGGILEEDLEKIFDLYSTSGNKEENDGVGMFIARKLVESKFSGKLEGFNIETGSCFRFTFPHSE